MDRKYCDISSANRDSYSLMVMEVVVCREMTCITPLDMSDEDKMSCISGVRSCTDTVWVGLVLLAVSSLPSSEEDLGWIVNCL